MASRTRSSSRSRPRKKAQFFILSAFVIIGIMFVLSQFVRPSEIFDTSRVVLMDEVFVFNNIKEKSADIVKTAEDQSISCDDLRLQLDEYKLFVEGFARQRNAKLTYEYAIDCAQFDVDFDIKLESPRVSMASSFVVT